MYTSNYIKRKKDNGASSEFTISLAFVMHAIMHVVYTFPTKWKKKRTLNNAHTEISMALQMVEDILFSKILSRLS